jgi:hypothetical protein
VPLWREEKSFATKNTKFTTKELKAAIVHFAAASRPRVWRCFMMLNYDSW